MIARGRRVCEEHESEVRSCSSGLLLCVSLLLFISLHLHDLYDHHDHIIIIIIIIIDRQAAFSSA